MADFDSLAVTSAGWHRASNKSWATELHRGRGVGPMLVTMRNSELVNKLVVLADGNIDLVQNAIRATADKNGEADLKKVVDYIVKNRRERLAAVA